MIALIQRVKSASLKINSKVYSKIDKGILVLLGIIKSDSHEDSEYIIRKLINLRIFPSNSSNLDVSVKNENASILIISNFTLSGITRSGNRPDFSNAMSTENAKVIYEKFIVKLKEEHPLIKTGVFGEEMEVELNNWGPLTLSIDSKDRKISRSSF